MEQAYCEAPLFVQVLPPSFIDQTHSVQPLLLPIFCSPYTHCDFFPVVQNSCENRHGNGHDICALIGLITIWLIGLLYLGQIILEIEEYGNRNIIELFSRISIF